MKGLIGIALVLMLFVEGCTSTPSPSSTPASAASAAPALSTPNAAPAVPVTAIAPASPVVTGVSTPVRAASSVPSAVAGTPTPAKAEEAREATENPTEEAAEPPPAPNPLPTVPPGGNQAYAPVSGVDITKTGAAASIHGSVTAGQAVFVQNCQVCHGVEGKGGIPNPGSDDGTIPPLNPIDTGFKVHANGNPATFAQEIDLFIQHGSRPAGPSPAVSMIPWGDQKKLTQQQIADVEAYVMQLNGVTWPSS